MKIVEIVYERYNRSLINVTDFYRYFNNFCEKFYDILMFRKVIKIYKNFKEILKLNLAILGA